MTNKTILSVAISCVLYTGMSTNAFAVEDVAATTTVPSVDTTTTESASPVSSGGTIGTTSQPPVDGGAGQPKPPVDGGAGQPKPPVDGGAGQPKPPVDDGAEQPKPPVDDGAEQPKPPVDDEAEQPKPPVDDGAEQPKPPVDDEAEQPKPPVDDGAEQPKPPVDDEAEQPKPPVDDGAEQPKPPVKPNNGGQSKPNKPNFADFGVEEKEVGKFNAEKVNKLPPQAFGAFDRHNIKQLPPEAMTEVTSEQVEQLPAEAIEALGPEQVRNMPPQAMVGLKAKQLGSLPPIVLQKLPAEHFKNIDAKEMQSLDGKDLSKILVNIDITVVGLQDVQDRLPPGWAVNAKGHIKPPAGTKLALPPRPPVTSDDGTAKVVMPSDMPDLTKGFTLGGQVEEGGTVLDGMNECLRTIGLSDMEINQEETGVLVVKDSEGLELALAPEPDSIEQVEEGTKPEVTMDEAKRYVVVTPNSQKVAVVPAPKDPRQVAQGLGAAGSLKMGKHGAFTLESRQDEHSPRQVRAVAFSALVHKTDKAPGLYFEEHGGEIVYADGTAQTMIPATPVPEKFVEKAQEIPGVEQVRLDVENSIFLVKYKGMMFKLYPITSEVQATPVAEGETVEPSIDIQPDGTVKYTTQEEEGTDQLEVTLGIVQEE